MNSIICFLALFAFQDLELSIQERFRVTYVLLDVVANDRKGNIISDLKASDFQVKENKKNMEITYFDTLDFREGAEIDLSQVPEEFRDLVPERPIQQIIVAMDLESIKLMDTRRFFKKIKEFVASLDELGEYRINLYSMDRGSLTKGFINDPNRVLSFLEEYEQRHYDTLERQRGGSPGGDSLLLGDNPRRESRGRYGTGGSKKATGNEFVDLEEEFKNCVFLSGGDSSSANYCISDALVRFMEEQEVRTERVIGQLELMTYKFEEEKGLKMILFVSPGFAPEYVSSAFEMARSYRQNRNNQTSDIFDLTRSKLHVNADFRRVLHACIKNRIIFHTFDIYNGYHSFDNGRTYRNYANDMTAGLRDLAQESGGMFTGTNDLKGSIFKTLERNRFFYVLGYNSPDAAKPGVYRKIKIKSKRKGVKLRHRTGYYGR